MKLAKLKISIHSNTSLTAPQEHHCRTDKIKFLNVAWVTRTFPELTTNQKAGTNALQKNNIACARDKTTDHDDKDGIKLFNCVNKTLGNQ